MKSWLRLLPVSYNLTMVRALQVSLQALEMILGTLSLSRVARRYVGEKESVRRQLGRGRAAIAHNQRVNDSGLGELLEVRPTDLWYAPQSSGMPHRPLERPADLWYAQQTSGTPYRPLVRPTNHPLRPGNLWHSRELHSKTVLSTWLAVSNSAGWQYGSKTSVLHLLLVALG